MPVIYRINGKKRLIHTRCIGKVTPADILYHFQSLARDPECPDRLDVLLDLSESTSVPESHQLHDVREEIGRIRDKVQFDDCAIVAPTDVLFGMSRMFEAFASQWFHEIRVYRTLVEAEAWLRP